MNISTLPKIPTVVSNTFGKKNYKLPTYNDLALRNQRLNQAIANASITNGKLNNGYVTVPTWKTIKANDSYTVQSRTILSHTIQSGDTLWGISKSYGITLEQLKKNNSITNNNYILLPGMTISVLNTTPTVVSQPPF